MAQFSPFSSLSLFSQFSAFICLFPTASVSLHTPERVGEAAADLTLPYSSSSAMTQRRLNSSSSQQWRWARPTAATAAVGPLSLLTSDLRPRQRALTSAQTYFPNSRASLWVSTGVHVSLDEQSRTRNRKKASVQLQTDQCGHSFSCRSKLMSLFVYFSFLHCGRAVHHHRSRAQWV